MKLTFTVFMLCLGVFIVIISCKGKENPKKEYQQNRTEKIKEQLNESALDDDKYKKINALLIRFTSSEYNTNNCGFDNIKLEGLRKLEVFVVDQVSSFDKEEVHISKDGLNPLKDLKCNYHIQDRIGNRRKGHQVMSYDKDDEIEVDLS